MCIKKLSVSLYSCDIHKSLDKISKFVSNWRGKCFDHRDYVSGHAGELASPSVKGRLGRLQDGAPLRFHCEVCRYRNETHPHRWIGRATATATDLSSGNWPPRSPDLTPCDFFLWGYVKCTAYRTSLPHDLQELRQRIITAVTATEEDLLEKVWQELDYRLDVCRVTWGAHIKCL
jgi:hypothetical protein